MATSTSGYHTLSDGHEVYVKTWTPSTEPKAHLVLLHGFSDRVDHYDTFFNILLASYPIRVIGWDRRGWGKSVHDKAERGNTGDMFKQLTELNDYLNHTITTIPDLKSTPLFLMGHSMGGQETAYYMLNTNNNPMTSTNIFSPDARPHISGFVLESPYIGLDPATQPSSLKVLAGRIACKLLPQFQISNPVPVEYISPDKAVQKMYGDDPLCHGLGTLQCFRDMLERSAELSALAHNPGSPPTALKNKLPCPVLWTHGTVDKACDFGISKALCDGLEACGQKEGDKVFKTYDGWFHQLHNEPEGCKEAYAKDVGDWVMGIVGRGR